MSSELERDVAQHYQASDLADRLLQLLQAAGKDIERLTIEDMAPLDEFHMGGRPATKYAVAKLPLHPGRRLLDVGCGVGGAARYAADTTGALVTGIDLTPEFVAVARDLTRRTGLAERVTFEIASARAMPFPDATFDAALTMHVAMNIKDRAGLYREIARVLAPGARVCLYDVMRGPNEGLHYPVPWAQSEATSHLTTPAETEALLTGAGFRVLETEDRTAFALDSMQQAAQAPPQPLTTQLLMGKDAGEKLRNLRNALVAGAVAPVVMVAERHA